MTVTLTVARNESQGLASTANESAQPICSEYAISPREKFRVEVCQINGRPVVRLSRWKITVEGMKRTGCAFEFGAHRCKAVTDLLSGIEKKLGGLRHAAS